MKKIIFLLLCCGLIVDMVGCGSNTAPPPSETATISETKTTDTTTETLPPKTAVEPTEKEKEPISAESKGQAVEPSTAATTPTKMAKPKGESKPPATTYSAEDSATEYQPMWEDINVYGYMADITSRQ